MGAPPGGCLRVLYTNCLALPTVVSVGGVPRCPKKRPDPRYTAWHELPLLGFVHTHALHLSSYRPPNRDLRPVSSGVWRRLLPSTRAVQRCCKRQMTSRWAGRQCAAAGLTPPALLAGSALAGSWPQLTFSFGPTCT